MMRVKGDPQMIIKERVNGNILVEMQKKEINEAYAKMIDTASH